MGWSRTQRATTLSSAEAELVAMTKVTAEIIGIGHMMRDWGRGARGTVYADSSAALAIADRKGSGKLRHINVGLLWVQQKKEDKEVEFHKVEGTQNPADMLTKHLASDRLQEHGRRAGLEFREGRAESGLQLSSGVQ